MSFLAGNTANRAGDTVFVKKQIQHPNLVQFKGISFAPTAIMLEYFGLSVRSQVLVFPIPH